MEIKKLFEHCRSGQTQKVLAMVKKYIIHGSNFHYGDCWCLFYD